jgi:hypothetical protein
MTDRHRKSELRATEKPQIAWIRAYPVNAGNELEMSHQLATIRDCFRPISLARNVAATVVTVGGAAFVMFVPSWWTCENEWSRLVPFTIVVGLIASVLGQCRGVIWFVVWMLSITVFDEINNWPDGDPELGLGLVLHGMAALPMIPLGIPANSLKNHRYKYSCCLEN